jgi:hypothetical protein
VDGNDATGKLTVARVSHRRCHELSLSVEKGLTGSWFCISLKRALTSVNKPVRFDP